MAKADGDAFVDGDILSFQEMNRILTNFWQAIEPSNLQSGCLYGKSTNEKLFMKGISALEEVLQRTRSSDLEVRFSGLNILTFEEDVLVYEGEVLFYNPI
jgi:hypothetical protein